jgi:predicted 3-demethylubiquinone-9 3-methyltransferase (glyoxalase superfamily)
MGTTVCTHLMFEGSAEEAMTFYVSLFPDSGVTGIERYGAGEAEGKVRMATFTLAGRPFICIDSPVKHNFTFTPSMSMFVDFATAEELDAAFDKLSAGGSIFMPLDNYGFSRRFGWLQDRFGVSWQLNLPS